MNIKVKIGLSIVVVLLLLLGLLGYLNQYKVNLIEYQEPVLSDSDKVFLQQRLDDAIALAGGITVETSDVEKFNIYINLAGNYYTLGYFALAQENYLKALELRPGEQNIWHMYSTVLVSMRDYRTAIKANDKAIEIAPAEAEYWRWKIDMQKNFFNLSNEELNSIYLEALEKTGEHADVITYYAKFLEQIGDLEAAEHYWQRAIERNPDGRTTYEAEITRLNHKIEGQ